MEKCYETLGNIFIPKLNEAVNRHLQHPRKQREDETIDTSIIVQYIVKRQIAK